MLGRGWGHHCEASHHLLGAEGPPCWAVITKTQVMYIAKLKDGKKRAKKTFSMILERVFEVVWCRGRKWNHIKKDLWSWSVFLLLKYWLPFYLRKLLELFFLFPFSFFLFFLCSVSWGLGGFDDIWGENHFFKNLFSNVMTWNCMVMTMDILAVDAYSRIELCTPI
jgi:hypothetical protein